MKKTNKQLRIPIHIPTIGEQCIARVQERIKKAVPDGSVVHTKMIYIKNLLK
jgi:hypothetical protein